MQEGINQKGFTLLELSISMLFVSLLSIAVVVVINNTISAYQRGTTLSRLDSTGSEIVEDIRNSIQDSINRTKLGHNVSITKKSNVEIAGSTEDNVPIYGVFCSGSYTYFWNSGYFFTDDAKFDEKTDKKWAMLKTSENDPTADGNYPPFRLIKIADPERKVCLSLVSKDLNSSKDYASVEIENGQINNIFDVSELYKNNPSLEQINLLQNDSGNDLALYNLVVNIPAVNFYENISLYNVFITLGTITGGVIPTPSGSSCATPSGSTNWSNSCAVSEFKLAAQSNASEIGVTEQIFDNNPAKPDVIELYTIEYIDNFKDDGCPNRTLQSTIFPNRGKIATYADTNFSICPGATFLYWKDKAETIYNPGNTIDQNQSLTLYAVWKPAAKITYHNDNCTSNTFSPITLKNTSTVANNMFSCTEADFQGWQTSDGQSYTEGAPIADDQNFDLYAVWKAWVFYTVTYHSNNNIDDDNNVLNNTRASSRIREGQTYTINGPVGENGWTNRGMKFESWNTKANGTGTTYRQGDSITMTQNLDLYAQWALRKGGGTETEHLVKGTSRFLDTLVVFPDNVTPGYQCEGSNCYINGIITGKADGSDTGIVSIGLNGNLDSEQDICEKFTTVNGQPMCPALHNDFIMEGYELVQSGTKSAIIYLEIMNNININDIKDGFVFYTSGAYDIMEFENEVSYTIQGYTGTPRFWHVHPIIYYFAKGIKDELIATDFLDTNKTIEGKNAIIENNNPRYWVIAKIKYTRGDDYTITEVNPKDYRLTFSPINKFTNANLSSFED